MANWANSFRFMQKLPTLWSPPANGELASGGEGEEEEGEGAGQGEEGDAAAHARRQAEGEGAGQDAARQVRGGAAAREGPRPRSRPGRRPGCPFFKGQ